MTNEQALSIVSQAAALAPLNKAQHLQIEQAIIVLTDALKAQEEKPSEH